MLFRVVRANARNFTISKKFTERAGQIAQKHSGVIEKLPQASTSNLDRLRPITVDDESQAKKMGRVISFKINNSPNTGSVEGDHRAITQ